MKTTNILLQFIVNNTLYCHFIAIEILHILTIIITFDMQKQCKTNLSL